MNSSVDTFYLFQRAASHRRLVENDRPHRANCPVQATERVSFEVTVLGNPGGDLWMGQLHEQRPPTREK
jgi:hypothetical protein